MPKDQPPRDRPIPRDLLYAAYCGEQTRLRTGGRWPGPAHLRDTRLKINKNTCTWWDSNHRPPAYTHTLLASQTRRLLLKICSADLKETCNSGKRKRNISQKFPKKTCLVGPNNIFFSKRKLFFPKNCFVFSIFGRLFQKCFWFHEKFTYSKNVHFLKNC